MGGCRLDILRASGGADGEQGVGDRLPGCPVDGMARAVPQDLEGGGVAGHGPTVPGGGVGGQGQGDGHPLVLGLGPELAISATASQAAGRRRVIGRRPRSAGPRRAPG
jgi:hypothetical protein